MMYAVGRGAWFAVDAPLLWHARRSLALAYRRYARLRAWRESFYGERCGVVEVLAQSVVDALALGVEHTTIARVVKESRRCEAGQPICNGGYRAS